MLRRGFLLQQKPPARTNRQLRTNLLGLNAINSPLVSEFGATKEHCREKRCGKNNKAESGEEITTYFDLLPLNVKQILMQWIWYTQPKINWMGDGRDESIKLMRMVRLQRIANEILKINNVRIYGEKNV